ncbi:hypothetical protein FBU30_000219 [Linnemannia zychae]|nr:hypothetical protein FBU30_000219 [Linnemannia zychae]
MVLDMQVPIPGGATGTLTSLSPHANVLPSSITGISTPRDTSPRPHASPKMSTVDARISEDLGSDGDNRNKKSALRHKDSSQDLRKSTINSKALQDDLSRRNSSQSDDVVTVDSFTGMVTTAPGIKRMSTPVSSGLSASASAAAAANRERLEQRMRGIFKKPTESHPSTPPLPKGSLSSPSIKKSASIGFEDKADISREPSTEEEHVDMAAPDNIEMAAQKIDETEATTILGDALEDSSETSLTNQSQISEETVKSDGIENETNGKEADDTVDEQEEVKASSDTVNSKENAEVNRASCDKSSEAPEANPTTDNTIEEPHTKQEYKNSVAMPQDQELGIDQDEATVIIPEMVIDHHLNPSSSEDVNIVPTLNDHSDTPLGTAESDQITTTSVNDEPIAHLMPAKDTINSESTIQTTLSTTDTNPLKKILDQREEQLFKVMQEQSALIDKLRDLEDAKAAEDARNAVKISGLEKMIETQKKELEVARGSNLASQPKSIQRTLEEQRGLLEEKDEQIRGLLAEEMEKAQIDTQKKLDKINSDYVDSQSKVAKLMEDNKQLQDSVKSLHDVNQRQNKQITKAEAELTQLRDDKAGLQMGLDRAWQELAEARKASAELSSQTHAAALEREMKMNEELQMQLDSLKMQHAAVESSLRQDIQELRVSLSNREELAGEKEDQLYMEIRNLQSRLEQNDHDSYELQETLDEARRPLLRQIEVLQNQQSAANRNWDKVEKNLARRISEAEENTSKAQERERITRDKLDEVKSQVIALEARLETLRIADTQLRSDMSISKRTLMEKEEAMRQAQAELNRERLSRERAIEEAKEDIDRKWRREQQTEIEKLKSQIQQLQQQRSHPSGSDGDLLNTPSDSINARRPSSSSITSAGSPLPGGAGTLLHKMTNVQGRTSFESLTSPTNLDGTAPSLSRSSSSHTMTSVSGALASATGTPTVSLMGLGANSGGNTGQAITIERLNTLVRQMEGQVTFLTEQVRSANRNKDELSDELVKVTMELEGLQNAASKVPNLEQELNLLKERHRAALEMLGEKTEEVQELKADILDVKEAYRDQINDLLSQLEKLRRANTR